MPPRRVALYPGAMTELHTLLLMIAVVAGGLLLQQLLARALDDTPAADPRETIAIAPDGTVLITSRSGETFAFHRNEVWSVRGRDLLDGLAEVIVDLFERRIVVGVSSKTVQQDMLHRLARWRTDPR